MDSKALKHYKSLKNKNSCREICDADPECNYYIHDKSGTCSLYPDAKKKCQSLIGALDGPCSELITYNE
jgi:hypothetical protein